MVGFRKQAVLRAMRMEYGCSSIIVFDEYFGLSEIGNKVSERAWQQANGLISFTDNAIRQANILREIERLELIFEEDGYYI